MFHNAILAAASVAIVSTLALGAVRAEAEKFPLRDPGPDRTAFVESTTKTCVRVNLEDPDNADAPKEVISRFCDCAAAVEARLLTKKDLEEMAQGGTHATPRFRKDLEEMAQGGMHATPRFRVVAQAAGTFCLMKMSLPAEQALGSGSTAR